MGARYLQTGAVFAGNEFSPTEQKKATERALEFQRENEQLKAENADLEQRVAALEQELELDGTALLRAEEEVENAQQQLGALQSELDNWRKKMFKIDERLRNSDQQHLQYLEQLTTLLDRMVQQHETKSDEGSPWKQPSTSVKNDTTAHQAPTLEDEGSVDQSGE